MTGINKASLPEISEKKMREILKRASDLLPTWRLVGVRVQEMHSDKWHKGDIVLSWMTMCNPNIREEFAGNVYD